LETSLSNTPKSSIKKKRKNQSAPPIGSRNKIKQVLVSFAKSSFLSDTNSSAAQTKALPKQESLLSEHKTEQCYVDVNIITIIPLNHTIIHPSLPMVQIFPKFGMKF
jgi:hypothetical protein